MQTERVEGFIYSGSEVHLKRTVANFRDSANSARAKGNVSWTLIDINIPSSQLLS
jgi:hypothetical protein